jgi:hypothetical protein
MGRKIIDNQSGYRLVSRRLLEIMTKSKEFGFEFEIEMIVFCVKNGWRLDWIPIQTIYADEISHIKPLKHMINYLKIVFHTWKMMNTF